MNNQKVHLPFGLITGLLIILIVVVQHYGIIPATGPAGNLPLLPIPFGIIACCFRYSKVHDGYVSFGQVFASGFKAASILSLLTVGFILLATYIWPDILKDAFAEAKKGFDSNKKLSAAERDEMMVQTKKFARVGIVGFTLFMYMALGAFFALIGAAVAKKNGPQQLGESLDKPTTF